MMKWFAFCLAIAASPAFAADDPAITVCEEIIKARLRAPKSYERVSAEISGLIVYVTYDAVNIYNAPLRGADKCLFVPLKDGRYSLTADTTEHERELDIINKELEKAKASGYINDDERDALNQRLDAIVNKTTKNVIKIAEDILIAEQLDIFPIDPSTTALRAAD